MNLSFDNIPNPVVQKHLYGSAREAVGKVVPCYSVFAFNKGEYGITDVVTEIARQIGPCHADLCTWTAAKRDISYMYQFVHSGLFTSTRWLVDRSFLSRQPEMFTHLCETYGPECVRITRTHAKFIILRNENYNISIRTSMNLNKNARLENWEATDNVEMASFFSGVVDAIFDAQVMQCWDHGTEHESQFTNLVLVGGEWVVAGSRAKKGRVKSTKPLLL